MDPLLPLLDLLEIDPPDVLLQLLGFMDILFRKLDDGVNDILVLLGDEHEDVVEVLRPKDVVVLFEGVFDDFDHLQNQRLRPPLADCAVNLFLDICRHVGRKAGVDVQ